MIDRFSKELSTNFVETLRNYKENHFGENHFRCYDGASQRRIQRLRTIEATILRSISTVIQTNHGSQGEHSVTT